MNLDYNFMKKLYMYILGTQLNSLYGGQASFSIIIISFLFYLIE